MNIKDYKREYYLRNRKSIRKKQNKYNKSHKTEINEKNKEYRNNHKKEKNIIDKNYRDKHREKMKQYAREYWLKNKDRIKLKHKEYNLKNIEKIKQQRSGIQFRIKINEYVRKRRIENMNFAMKCRLSGLLRQAKKRYSLIKKIQKASNYGINYNAIIEHLKPFPKNISKYHIDHIKPLCSFDLTDLEQIKIAFAPENHQWLSEHDNKVKNGKV